VFITQNAIWKMMVNFYKIKYIGRKICAVLFLIFL